MVTSFDATWQRRALVSDHHLPISGGHASGHKTFGASHWALKAFLE
jgi:hypothetical protein